MAQLKVIVNKLNKRKSPVLNLADKSNVVEVMQRDAVFESVGQITNALGTWHVNSDGHWIWEKGVEREEAFGKTQPTVSLTGTAISREAFPGSEPNSAWLNLLGIAEAWKKSKGANVNIAVLDSGIQTSNRELTQSLFQFSADKSGLSDDRVCKNFLNSSLPVSDVLGHGSHCASLVSSTNSVNTIGVAPDAKLFIGKVTDQGEFDGFRPLKDAVLWAANTDEVDIISVSFGSSDAGDSEFSNLREAVNLAFQKGKIIVAAIGDRDNDTQPLFPALFDDFCISVGATDNTGRFWNGNVDSGLTNIFAPGVDIFSNGVNGKVSMSGNSQSTAIVSGIIALLISHLKSRNKKYTQATVLKMLLDSAKNMTDRPGKLIDPAKLFSNL